jgi:hypothetical protein
MNTGVCSSRAMDAHSSARDSSKGALEVILNRVAMGLALPAREWRAVVSDSEF